MERAFRWSAAGALALTLTQVVSGAPLAQGPVLQPERGSYSFRGLRVAVGAQSQAVTIMLRNAGRMPLQNIVATTSGDFVITANTCAATTLPATVAAAATPRARCSVAVAFKPSAPGLRSGGLTVSADGAAPQTVTLDGGLPVGIPSTTVGASAVQWVELPAPAALSASVTGPFAIALRTSYAYGAINGVTFATTTSTTGACAVTSGTACSLYLGIELLPSAPVGTSTGTVTLSNGVTYSVSGDVLGSALDVEPSSLNAGIIPVGSRSDATPVTVTNLSTAAFSVGAVSVTGPFTATSSCPATLAALASCTLSVTFKPTAVGRCLWLCAIGDWCGECRHCLKRHRCG